MVGRLSLLFFFLVFRLSCVAVASGSMVGGFLFWVSVSLGCLSSYGAFLSLWGRGRGSFRLFWSVFGFSFSSFDLSNVFSLVSVCACVGELVMSPLSPSIFYSGVAIPLLPPSFLWFEAPSSIHGEVLDFLTVVVLLCPSEKCWKYFEEDAWSYAVSNLSLRIYPDSGKWPLPLEDCLNSGLWEEGMEFVCCKFQWRCQFTCLFKLFTWKFFLKFGEPSLLLFLWSCYVTQPRHAMLWLWLWSALKASMLWWFYWFLLFAVRFTPFYVRLGSIVWAKLILNNALAILSL